jgi:5'-nucleotidase
LKILISNDDGIDSPGISALVDELKNIGDVVVIAPRTEQSAVGHGITMKSPLRITEFSRNGRFFGYAIDGTPADCIKIGIRNIMNEPPDIVLSGINLGSNAAINIIYSGTVSAAREAAIMDIPAIAVSVTSHSATRFGYAAKIAAELTKQVVSNKLPNGTLLNVNVPDLPENEIAGIRLTQQGKSKWDDIYEERQDPYGKNYYWLTGNMVETDSTLEADQFAIRNNYVSITPIHFDLTDYKTYDAMRSWKLENLLKRKS